MALNSRLLRGDTIRRALLVAAVASCISGTVVTSSSLAATGTSCGSWTVVPSANVGNRPNLLYEVSALSDTDVWAVGRVSDSFYGRTLAEHWDGASWKVVPTPRLRAPSASLEGVAAVAPDDVWSVGSAIAGNDIRPLIEHWDGTAWKIAPPSEPVQGALHAVAAATADDVWATGNDGLALHWDGSSWAVVPTADPSADLWGVAAIAANVPASNELTSNNRPLMVRVSAKAPIAPSTVPAAVTTPRSVVEFVI